MNPLDALATLIIKGWHERCVQQYMSLAAGFFASAWFGFLGGFQIAFWAAYYAGGPWVALAMGFMGGLAGCLACTLYYWRKQKLSAKIPFEIPKAILDLAEGWMQDHGGAVTVEGEKRPS
jgi:hypothetical protein